MKHNLACKGTVTYTVIAINETEQARQGDNCGGFVVEPKPKAAVEEQDGAEAAWVERDICNGGKV